MAKVICLDAGHGGHDGGATANGLKEKDLTLDIAKRIQSKLKNYNVKVIMTRTTDKFLSLTERTNIANRNKADLFLSVHINSSGGTGFESFIYNGSIQTATKGYQSTLHSAIMKQIDVKDRGKKSANFAVVRQSNMPAVLTETLFIDTKSDANKLKDSNFLNSVAQGPADGIVKQLGLKKSGKTNTSSKPSKPSKKPSKKPASKGKANYNTKSIVTFLQSINQPFSLSHRKKLASYYNVKNYKGQASLNLQLLDLLKKDYKKRGKLRTSKPKSTTTTKAKPKANLKVDGYMGTQTIKALQRYFNMKIVDGVISKPS